MEKGDLSAGECDLFVGFVGVGLSISESPNLLGFPTQTSPGFTENGQKKTKYPVNSLGDNVLLKSQVRGKWPASTSLEGNIQSSNHSLQPGYAEEYL